MSKNSRIFAASLTAAFLTSMVPGAICATPNCALTPPPGTSCNIDNFKTGGGKVGPVSSGSKSVNQTGSGIAGGTRTLNLANTPGANEFAQTTEAQVRPSSTSGVPSALIWSTGYKNFSGLQVVYGDSTALGVNMTPYDRLRVTFDGLQQGLNFNAEVWDSSNILSDCGINIDATTSTFTVDFPFSQFGSTTINWSALSGMLFEFQAANDAGAPNLAITGIAAILGSAHPPATYTCVFTPAP